MADPTRHATRSELFERFALLGVEAPTVQYLAHKTVEEGQRLRVAMAGTFTKSLLLRAKKSRLFLLIHSSIRKAQAWHRTASSSLSGRVGASR